MKKKKVVDRRVQKVLELLKAGKTREEIAELFDYTSYRSLQQYMRRRDYAWNDDNEMYEPMTIDDDEAEQNDRTVVRDAKILRILTSFDTEYPDPKKIAEDLNFQNYDALKEYMLKKNYTWDTDEQNYVKSEDTLPVDVDVDVDIDHQSKKEFIDYLYDNRKILKRVLAIHMMGKDLPNYTVRGDSSTKTIYMSNQLSNLVKEYSNEKKMTQRQVIESALIEFFKNYGFKDEIGHLLK